MSAAGSGPGRQSGCPGDVTLRRLGDLNWNGASEVTLSPDDPSAAVLDHVEVCGSCQRRLEAIAIQDRSSLEELLGSSDQTMESVSAFTELDDHVLRGFRILRLLGKGGQSRVYLAEELPACRRIALKLIPVSQEGSGPQREQWLTEVRAAASIEHQNVVRLYRVEETPDYFLLVFEYINGGTLRDWLSRPVSQIQIAQFMKLVARTVHQIHQRGILHLDLKPSNILMETSFGSAWELAVPKVADFGVSSWRSQVDPSDRSSRIVRGTPSYMAPEQFLGNEQLLTEATDVYGLGGVLYCMLTGRPPVTFARESDLLEQLLATEIASPASLDSAIDEGLSEIAMTCLQRKSEDRFQSAQELAETLDRWIAEHTNAESRASVTGQRWFRWLSVAIAASLILIAVRKYWGAETTASSSRLANPAMAAAGNGNKATFAELVSQLSSELESSGAATDEQSLVQRLFEPPAAFALPRAARLAVDSRRFTEQLLTRQDVSTEQLLQIATLQYASGSRFQAGSIAELYSVATYLLEDSVQLYEFVLRRCPNDQAVLEKLIAARVSLATVRIEKGLNSPELVRRHYQATLSQLLPTLSLVNALTDERQRIYWAGYILDSLRLQYWGSRFAGDEESVDLFRRWEQQAWQAFKNDQQQPDLAVRHALMKPLLLELKEADRKDQWILPNSRPVLQREFLFLRLAEPFFSPQFAHVDADATRVTTPVAPVNADPWLLLLRQTDADIRALQVDGLDLPLLVHEDLIRPLTALATQYRAAGLLHAAEDLQRRYLKLCESVDQLFPDNSDIQLAFSEAHLQAWKNAIRRDQTDLAIASLQKSLEFAQAAVALSPESPRARDQVSDRIKRLTRLQTTQESSAAERK